MITDLAKAREWLQTWTDVSGVEGIVIKPLTSKYLPSYRGRTKIRRRDTTEAVSDAVTGTLTRPQFLVLGRYDQSGRLRPVGSTVPLRPDVSRQVGEQLTPAGPGDPFEGVRFTAAWGSGDVLDVVLVRPEAVAEVSAHRAVDYGVFRHPLRFQRIRLDMTAGDVPPFGAGPAAAADRCSTPAP
ncbi:ATP-dependent DNA ligase [Streptomyces sp. NPDC096033]|uniref:ATP-dependent DNA ligase n=1 Tax=Streptomyces sp. NPDC096033 TaxID=3366071 RepID=UPI003826FE62